MTDCQHEDCPRDGRTERLAGEIFASPVEQQRLVLNDLIPTGEVVEEMGLEPRGPDEELFFGNPEGDFL